MKNFIWIRYITIISIFFFCCQGCSTTSENVAYYETKVNNITNYPFSAIIYGDTRSRHSLEIWRDDASVFRQIVANKIAEEKPAFVIHTGDIVLKGSRQSDWEEIDQVNAKIREGKIPFFPCLGNHEYTGNNVDALTNYFSRFPDLFAQHWYSLKIMGAVFLILDSNDDELEEYQKNAQIRWCEQTLAEAQSDPNIKIALLFTHHPPYTNGSYHGDHEWIKKNIVPLMKKYSKARIMFSAHCHTYEHFYFDPIHFIVSAGGGAPLFLKSEVSENRHQNLYIGNPRFHYCYLTFYQDHLDIQVKMLDDEKQWYEQEKITLTY